MALMKKMITAAMMATLTIGSASAKIVKSNCFEDVENHVNQLSKKYGAENVLVVFDNDETLVKTKNWIGSNKWFSWQASMLGSGSDKSVASSFGELLEVQGLILSMSKLETVELTIRQTVDSIQSNGNKVIVLTSRGPGERFSTVREQLLNGIDMKRNAVKMNRFRLPTKPYSQNTLGELGFSEKEIQDYKLYKASKPVQYSSGIFLTEGQHKGAMLRIFLKKANIQPKAVVFVDDTYKHVERVNDAMEAIGVDVVSMNYTKAWEHAENNLEIENQLKDSAHKQWNVIQKAFVPVSAAPMERDTIESMF